MIEYFKDRFLLDWNFMKDFWYIYTVIGIVFVGWLIVQTVKK